MSKPLTELELNQCRYPMKFTMEVDGHYLFCAKPVVSGTNYCTEHHKLCRPPAAAKMMRLQKRT